MISHFELYFNRSTTKRRNTLVGRMYGRVMIEIVRINSNEIRIAYIETPKELRRTGLASAALSWLCELADECEMKLTLTPASPKDSEIFDMNTLQLTAWYQKFGFARIGFKDEMMRYPHAAKV